MADTPQPATLNTDRPVPSLGRALVVGGGAVLVLIGMHLATNIIVLIAFSGLVTLLLAPLQDRLIKRGMRPALALLICLSVYVLVLAVTAIVVLIGLADFVNNLPTYRSAFRSQLDSIFGPSEMSDRLVAALSDIAEGLISTLTSGVVLLGYSVIVVAYFLIEARRGARRVAWASGGNAEVMERAVQVGGRMESFVVARTVLGLVAAVIETVALVILGVPSALLWGVLSFLMSFVPNIGFIVALIPPTLLALALYGPLTALAVVIAYSVTNFAVDYVLQPRYIGTSVNMSAAVVTLSIVFWSLILGPAGALLAIPLTIVAIAIADAFTDSRPYARLLVDDVGSSD